MRHSGSIHLTKLRQYLTADPVAAHSHIRIRAVRPIFLPDLFQIRLNLCLCHAEQRTNQRQLLFRQFPHRNNAAQASEPRSAAQMKQYRLGTVITMVCHCQTVCTAFSASLIKTAITQLPRRFLQRLMLRFCLVERIHRKCVQRHVPVCAKLPDKCRVCKTFRAADAVLHMHRCQAKMHAFSQFAQQMQQADGVCAPGYPYCHMIVFFYHMILSDKYLYFLLHLLPSVYRSRFQLSVSSSHLPLPDSSCQHLFRPIAPRSRLSGSSCHPAHGHR